MRHTFATILGVVALAGLLSGCTLRYAHTSFADEALDGAKGPGIEGGVYFWDGDLGGQRADVGLFGTYQQFDFFTDAAKSQLAGRARWFPLAESTVNPFLGAGVGVYRLNRTESVLTCRGRGICLSDRSDQRGQATGLSPHAVLGAEVALGASPFALVAAGTREFGGFDSEWNMRTFRFSAGVTYRR